MEQEFIPYEQALDLKKLGFDEPCFGYYTGDKMHLVIRPLMLRANELESYVVTAPTFSQAFRWFREKYGFYNQIHKGYGWEGIIRNSVNGNIEWNDGTYNSPEEAELACLIKLIEIVKNNDTHPSKTKH
jgi:hypothetical protein